MTDPKKHMGSRTAIGIAAALLLYALSSGPMMRTLPRVGRIVYAPLIWTFGSTDPWASWLEFWNVETARSACLKNLREIEKAKDAEPTE